MNCSEWSTTAVDRKVFSTLVKTIEFESDPAKTIVGFWKWLDTFGHVKNNSALNYSLSVSEDRRRLITLAHHALRCLNFLTTAASDEDDIDYILTPTFFSENGFSFSLLRENRERAMKWIQGFVDSFSYEDDKLEKVNDFSRFFRACRAFFAWVFGFGMDVFLFLEFLIISGGSEEDFIN